MRELIAEGVFAIVAASGIPLVVVALLAGACSLLQAVTQVQEASLMHLVRLIAFGATVFLCGHIASDSLQALFVRSLHTVVVVGGR